MDAFIYQGLPSRVVFGAGSIEHLEREIDLLGAKRAIVLSTPQQREQAEALAERLGSRVAGVFAKAVVHVPVPAAREAPEYAAQVRSQCALAEGVGKVVSQPQELDARGDCLYGAWLCGAVLGCVGMALHHKLCHTLGGTFTLPHAETHTIVLPHALAYNRDAAPQAMKRIARSLGTTDAAQGAFDLARNNGAPTALKEIGFKKTDIDIALDIALKNPYWNPRPLARPPS